MSPIPFNVLNTDKHSKKKTSFQSHMIRAAAIMGLATASVVLPLDKIPIVKNILPFDNAQLGNKVEAASAWVQVTGMTMTTMGSLASDGHTLARFGYSFN
ncbi:MAG: hypothetical protein Q8934_22350, partial [Bacillota bacterium]|nr:hypothetical protein [Bacillota bacterium]